MTRHDPLRRRATIGIGAAMLAALSGCLSLGPGNETEAIAFDRGAALASVNAFRAENGLGPLASDARLMRAAETQSEAMAARGRMDHAVAGRLPGRVEAVGYDWSTTAENIGRGYRDYDAAMMGWVNSPGHRKNLLNPAVTQVGFGAARDAAAGRNYWTQIFAAPRPERAAEGGLIPAG